MITRSADYVEYCRDTARRLRNLQDLALRGKNKQALTRRVQERIAREVALTADDDMVDIGCGDGTLLLLAKKAGVRSATGFHASEEESAISGSTPVKASLTPCRLPMNALRWWSATMFC